ncbi:MAG: peroxiredoxin family protein [Verrucomicrobia bacterium]|nr:peroxiredoxin family protein [Verrucomicrobiota bacterium]MDA1068697.1 peroxiredoxin family protein [Verrucomicrobiota bacterium]
MKKIPFFHAAIVALTFILSSNLQADNIGLNVGDKAPEFKLIDQNGKEVSLSELTAKHDKVALAFYRSADWCPHCQRQLIGLQNDLGTMEEAGIKLVGISYDSVEILDRFSNKQSIGYTLLSDPGSKTIDAYKIRNMDVKPGRTEGIPHPTIFLLDNKGVIAAKLREESIRVRPTLEEIMAAAKAMD